METLKFIAEKGIQALNTELGITIKHYPEENLYVLNYDQIESPKTHPVVMECRGLIIDESFNVVSRSCDRFFNIGEAPDTQSHLDWRKVTAYEKVDGSLIRIYNYKDYWHVATRGTAFAESGVNGFNITFKEIVHKALCIAEDLSFQDLCNKVLDKNITYIHEVTATENRVVKRYEGYSLWYLAARRNVAPYDYVCRQEDADALGCKFPQQYKFNSVEACISTATHLKDLDEGYVVYQDGVPVCKVKSPTYVAVHAIRGEGLTPKRIMQLVMINEQDEYLTYFPEDEKFFIPYVDAFNTLMIHMHYTYEKAADIEDQKQFAIAVKDYPYSGVMFNCRRYGNTVIESFHKQTDSYKLKLFEAIMSNKIQEAA